MRLERSKITKASVWSLVIVLILLVYLIFTMLFTTMVDQVSDQQLISTRTPVPTFTPVPIVAATPVIQITPATATPSPTFTASPTLEPTPTSSPTTTPTPVAPLVVSSIAVNVRAGPGTNYLVIGLLSPNNPLVVIGQNESGTWWQVQQADGSIGWVAASVVEAKDIDGIPIAQAPSPPVPTPTPVPPEPPRPTYQYEPTGWYDDTNYGLTRFLGDITDVSGNPVNGVFVEAQCGSFRVISNPSGPVGWGRFNESETWPPGFYDITIDSKPVPCKWFLTVVATEDRETVTARLSETIEVEVTNDKSIIVANWRKNW